MNTAKTITGVVHALCGTDQYYVSSGKCQACSQRQDRARNARKKAAIVSEATLKLQRIVEAQDKIDAELAREKAMTDVWIVRPGKFKQNQFTA